MNEMAASNLIHLLESLSIHPVVFLMDGGMHIVRYAKPILLIVRIVVLHCQVFRLCFQEGMAFADVLGVLRYGVRGPDR